MVSNRQTGRSNTARDRKLSARPPGKRTPVGGGKRYYERRKNRSDARGKTT